MLKISLIEFFLRGLPEAFLFMLAAYAFSGEKIEKKQFCLTSISLAIIVYMVRLLPINYGVHTILNMVVFILICILILKQDFIITIKNGILIFIIQFLSEGVNFFIVESILKKDINVVFENPIDKLIYGMPSTVIVAIVVIITYVIMIKKQEKVEYGEYIQ